MKDSIKTIFTVALASIGIAAVLAGLTVEQGWVVSILWGWFMVPIGVPAISTPIAIGIVLTLSAMRMKRVKSPDEEPWETLAFAAIAPLVALTLGWIVKQFV
jgi:hypothetical protein